MLFHFPIFSCNQLRVAFWIFASASRTSTRSPLSNGSLSLVGRPCCCSATSNAALNSSTGKGGPASYMGYPLPRAPGSVGRKPCGQGSPPFRPDGAGQLRKRKVDDEGDVDDADDDENLNSSSSDRWVPRSGPPGCVVCAPWSFGPLAPLVFLAGHCVGDPWAAAVVSRLTPDPGIYLAPILVAARNGSLVFNLLPPPSPWTSGSPCIGSTLRRRR
jgi:hypothetical protein